MRPLSAVLVLLAAAGAARAGDLIPTDSRFGPLRVASHKVEVTVDNQIALTRVEQVFANDHQATLEAHYVFPIPKGASIIDFSMTVNGKVVRGELLEKERARSIYEGIVRQSKDPGLLEHVGANLFRVRVFPILANSQQKMEMTYVERLSYDSGACRYVYPLLVPGGAKTTRADDFQFRWRLASAVPIKDVACTTHPVDVGRQGEATAEVKFAGRQIDLSKDLEITYRIERASSGMDLVAQRPKADEDGSFLLLLTPQANAPRLPKDMTFVFDTSGSMEGPRIKQAKAALKFCLSKLQPDDRFNVLSFASVVTTFENEHVEASDDAKARATRFVDALDASGGTNINGALLRALEHRAPAGRPHLILFLTDGEPTSGETRADQIVKNIAAANRSGVRIFAFGVGDELNRGLLEDLADVTRGVVEFVSDKENIEEKVSRLQKKIGTPVLSELEIDWGQAEVSAVYPKAPGDLFAGTQLALCGRYRKSGAFDVTLRGRAGDRKIEIKQKVTFPDRIDVAPALPYLWAMRKIAGLLDDVRRNGHNPEVVAEVIALSKQYRIATPYTSFLVLESEAAYDQQGIDRKGNGYKPPTPTAKAPPLPGDLAGKTADEPSLFFPEAKGSDHNESADNEDYRARKAGAYDALKGDSMRSYGARFGGRENLVPRGGGTMATESATLSSLKWLARHQNADGSWSADGFDACCTGEKCVGKGSKDHDVGVTSLSVLAFLGAGYTQLSKDEIPDPVNPGRVLRVGETVKKALQWLLSHQDAEGCVGERGAKYLQGHAISALALSEAYGMTASSVLKEPAQKAIDFLVAAQNPGKGWSGGDNDVLGTGWAVMALRSAELSGLTFPKTAYASALAWLDGVTDRNATPDATTAVSVAARLVISKDRREQALAASLRLGAELPAWAPTKVDFNYWYFGTLALYRCDGPDGALWRKWSDPLKNALAPNLKTAKDGCRHGSWDPESRGGQEGGRVWATALNTLTLELYYRFANVFGGK